MRLAAIPHAHPRWLVAGMLAAMVAIVWSGLDTIRTRQGGGMPLYGREASRDRLIVVDRQAGRLAIYAADGRPLQQLDGGAATAMPQWHDGRVFVIAADGTRSEAVSP
jgi:hypothetical protein